MKAKNLIITAFTLAIAACAFAQDENPQSGPGGPGRGPRPSGDQRPVPPLIAALDANHDGVIDATEIDQAAASLRKLDKNGDGQLTQDELRPPMGQGPRGNGPKDGRPQGGPRQRPGGPPATE